MRPPRLLTLFVLIALSTVAFGADVDPFKALTQMPPHFRSAGAEAFHFSSTDPLGGNEDFSNFVRTEADGAKVLVDQHGTGMVSRIWITASEKTMSNARIRIWIDSPEKATVDMAANDFFSSNQFPFEFPLVTDREASSGGYVCYLPISFSKRVVIDVVGLDEGRFYYNISGLIYEKPWTIEPFTYPLTGVAADKARETIEALKEIEPPARPAYGKGIRLTEGLIEPGKTVTFFSETQSGEFSYLRFFVPLWSREQLMDLSIRCTWDNSAAPAVDVPFPLFFASGETDTRGLLAGHVGGVYYSRFPMQFSSSARIELHNNGATPIRIKMASTQYVYLPGIDHNAPQLHARYHEVSETNSAHNFPWLSRKGRGWFAGVVMEMEGKGEFGYLEGDEFITIDGEDTPTVIGTGTEDYFGGGWYFENGPFSLPFHGCVTKTDDARTVCYRFHLLDAVPFKKSIVASIENGTNNTFRGAYKAAVFWYEAPGGEELRQEVSESPADAPIPPPGTNLVTNPGAEEFLNGWITSGTPNNMPTIDPWTHTPNPANHSGHHRFGISVGYKAVDCLMRQAVHVRPGTPHRASFQATNQDGTDEFAELTWVDGEWPGEERSLMRTPEGVHKEWTRYASEPFTPTKDVITLVVHFRHPLATGIASIHLDDIELVEIAE